MLGDQGARPINVVDHGGVTHSAYVHDPDGNRVELYIDVQPTWRPGMVDGDRIEWTNGTGAAVASGQLVKVGPGLLGVALVAIAIGASGQVAIEGVFKDVAKVSGAVFAKGEKLLWDVSAGAFDDSAATGASGDVMVGAIAWEAGSNGETTCTVKLTPGNTTTTA